MIRPSRFDAPVPDSPRAGPPYPARPTTGDVTPSLEEVLHRRKGEPEELGRAVEDRVFAGDELGPDSNIVRSVVRSEGGGGKKDKHPMRWCLES